MRITARQIRQIIREELTRTLREGFYDNDEEEYDYSQEGSGYEHLRNRPSTIEWTDGPVDHEWINKRLRYYRQHFSPHSWPSLAVDFQLMLDGEPMDPDVVSNYRNPDGTSVVSRQTVEELVNALG